MEKISISLTLQDIDKLNKITKEWDCASISHCFRQILKKTKLNSGEVL